MTNSEKLRAIADFIDAHPGIPEPLAPDLACTYDKEEMINAAKLPGARKVYDDEYLNVEVPVCEGLTLRFFCQRSLVCTPTKTEMVTVPERTYRKVIEWECHPLLEPSEAKQ